MGLLDRQAVYICAGGSCGGKCIRCQKLRLEVRVNRLEGDRDELLEVLRSVLPSLEQIVMDGGGPADRIRRDLVEATIRAHQAGEASGAEILEREWS